MSLSSQSSHPNVRSYVLKLHRDALPQREHLSGRLENMLSGRCFEFSNADELFAYLSADINLDRAQSEQSDGTNSTFNQPL